MGRRREAERGGVGGWCGGVAAASATSRDWAHVLQHLLLFLVFGYCFYLVLFGFVFEVFNIYIYVR